MEETDLFLEKVREEFNSIKEKYGSYEIVSLCRECYRKVKSIMNKVNKTEDREVLVLFNKPLSVDSKFNEKILCLINHKDSEDKVQVIEVYKELK